MLTRDLSSFFYSSHSLRVILLITCILLFHCEYSPLIADFSLGDWLCLKGVPVPAVLIPDLPPHRGLDPRSPANINTEELRHRDYNQKKTLLLCVSVFIQRNKRMRLRVKPATRSKTPSLSGRAGEGLIITLHSTLYTLNSKL